MTQAGKIIGNIKPMGNVTGKVNQSQGSYDNLLDKPTMNGEVIQGNTTSESLHIVACKTTAEWAELTTLISMPGEIYVYSDARIDSEGNPVPMVKIGDGNAYVVDLPFASAIDLRITDEDIENWNSKVAVRIENDCLIFY